MPRMPGLLLGRHSDVVEARAPAGSHLVSYNQPKSLGEVMGELAVAGRV